MTLEKQHNYLSKYWFKFCQVYINEIMYNINKCVNVYPKRG